MRLFFVQRTFLPNGGGAFGLVASPRGQPQDLTLPRCNNAFDIFFEGAALRSPFRVGFVVRVVYFLLLCLRIGWELLAWGPHERAPSNLTNPNPQIRVIDTSSKPPNSSHRHQLPEFRPEKWANWQDDRLPLCVLFTCCFFMWQNGRMAVWLKISTSRQGSLGPTCTRHNTAALFVPEVKTVGLRGAGVRR